MSEYGKIRNMKDIQGVDTLPLPQRLRELRGMRTQQQMAEAVGVTQASYAQWETGRRHEKLKAFARMCRALNVSADWLLGLDDGRVHLRIDGELTELREQADALADNANDLRRRLASLEAKAKK